jgi:hypothetical protein
MQFSKKRILLNWLLSLIIIINLSWRDSRSIVSTSPSALNNNKDTTKTKLKYINSSFENASQLDWEILIRLGLLT